MERRLKCGVCAAAALALVLCFSRRQGTLKPRSSLMPDTAASTAARSARMEPPSKISI